MSNESKTLDHKDCVSTNLLDDILNDVCEGFLDEMENADDEQELTSASAKLDGVLETLYLLRRYQNGGIPSYKDEDFSSLDINGFIQRFEMRQVETLSWRRKIFGETS